ncbi:hypothetical protein [Bdellovibrio sp. HCB-110]|uniref:hypothetical protein n=1 Tax=Bdellovibrio sp. HCB-110 TaxID=3391182 RepID=UPI0039B4B606
MKKIKRAVLIFIVISFESASACDIYDGNLSIYTEEDLHAAKTYCKVTGGVDYVVFGEPRNVSLPNLKEVGGALNFTGDSLVSLELPKLEKVGWWIHIASLSYHQNFLASVKIPRLQSGTLQLAVSPKLSVFNYNPCSAIVLDADTKANLQNLKLLKSCRNQ